MHIFCNKMHCYMCLCAYTHSTPTSSMSWENIPFWSVSILFPLRSLETCTHKSITKSLTYDMLHWNPNTQLQWTCLLRAILFSSDFMSIDLTNKQNLITEAHKNKDLYACGTLADFSSRLNLSGHQLAVH